ncbi:DUF7336 domain-containing protein [Massilioclostridium coli]|uniref:DUF7336 domain-containing protein n=1 Tax=Massilioclostridium coli TaxID=1870991 RepID=UPI00085C7F40|nr:hypothetical protein [Massilioclostridium coli]
MKSIFELTHFYKDEDGDDIATDIAVYSTREKAEQALEKFKKHPKFIDHPDDFNIDEYRLDEDNWTEGFFTYEW